MPPFAVQDSMAELLLSEDAVRIHAACAQSLQGAVDTAQLAMHLEHAGMLDRAARQCVFAPPVVPPRCTGLACPPPLRRSVGRSV